MWSVAFMGIISAGIGILVLISNTPPSSIKIKFRSVSEQMQYALPLAAGGLAGIVSKQLDKWVVMYFFTSEQFGTYSLGAIQIPIVFFITSSLTHAMMPSLVQMYDSGQAKGALSLWHKGIRKSALILFPAYIYLLILSFDIIIFLFGKEYLDAVGPFIVYLTLLPMRIAVYGTLLRAAGNTFPVFVAAFLGVIVNIVLSIGLVLSFKGTYIAFIAPAIATIIAVFVIALYQLIYVKKMLRVKFREVFPWRNLGIAMMISVVSAVIFIPLKMTVSSAILRIILGFFIYSVCFTALMIKLNLLEEDERKLVFLPFNYIRTKIRR
jgi:O-antigen/teichoic acid export membrane protein